MRKYSIEIVVFVSGAVVMAYELVASRILAPYLGTSTIIWTSVIGVILASLSLGYYWGGKIADRKPSLIGLGRMILLSSIFIAATSAIYNPFLSIISNKIADIRLSSVISSIILFAPTSVLLGMVSPYAAKLKLHNLKSSGSQIGSLYALSTLGSIFGTFLTGFFLLGFLGSSKILMLLTIVLAVTAVSLAGGKLFKMIMLLVLITTLSKTFPHTNSSLETTVTEMESVYSRIGIYDQKISNATFKNKIRILSYGKKYQSAMYLDSPNELVFDYSKYFDLVFHFNPDIKNVLLIGGGAYSYPKHILNIYPQVILDVVEIDPLVTNLAKKYFFLPDKSNLSIFHTDGRLFLNKAKKSYDSIFIDTFKSDFELPYEIFTLESIQKMHTILSDNGMVIANIVSGIDGENSKVIKSVTRTFTQVFPKLQLFRVYEAESTYTQNIILLAHKNQNPKNAKSNYPDIQKYLGNEIWINYDKAPLLTDDFSPLDYYYRNWNVKI
jgi:spermidine synthase